MSYTLLKNLNFIINSISSNIITISFIRTIITTTTTATTNYILIIIYALITLLKNI